jgi:hypothetical protein
VETPPTGSSNAQLAAARLANNHIKKHPCGYGISSGCIATSSTVSGHIDRAAAARPKQMEGN